jgi:hypothetical protein
MHWPVKAATAIRRLVCSPQTLWTTRIQTATRIRLPLAQSLLIPEAESMNQNYGS